ncbi:MAG: hypothetical protein WKF31_04765 [Thermoleophilaceae bacterium]
MAVEEGDRITRGQLLARIDDRSARSALSSALESLDSAREHLRDTRAGKTADELDRNRRSARAVPHGGGPGGDRPHETPAPPRARTWPPCGGRYAARG